MTKTHTVIAYLIALFLTLSWVETNLAAEESHTPGQFIAFTHENVERKYLLHVPTRPSRQCASGVRAPRVPCGRQRLPELGFNRLADANGFAVCYPQGADDLEGIPHWNARLKISKTDDIGFLSALASHLQAQHSLNASKTFVCGISNGGFMSYTLVAEKPDVFKAAASVIGTMSGHTWEHRNSIRPVPILQISGLDDEVIPYDGSMSKAGGWGGAPNQDVMMEFWRKLNKTKTEEVIKLSSKTTGHHYKDGVNGNEVWHYKIQGIWAQYSGQTRDGDQRSPT